MLGIVLMILKIIGLILLGIFGGLLALLVLLMLLPITYRVSVRGDSGKLEEIDCRIRILGIQVLPKRERRKKKNRIKQNVQKEKRQSPPQELSDENVAVEETADKKPSGVKTVVEAEKPSGVKTAVGTQKPADTDQPQNAAEADSRIRQSDDRVSQTDERMVKTAEEDKKDKGQGEKTSNHRPDHLKESLGQLWKEFTDDGNRRALGHILSELRYLLRHCGPSRVCADVDFSLGDPANTGYATAALSICPFSYGKRCRMTPDFQSEEFYVKGWLDVCGYVQLIQILLIGLRLLFDRDLRRIIQKIRKKL